MKPLLFGAAGAALLVTAAACTPSGPPVARAALDCPASEGDLSRQSVAPDGKTCDYVTRGGDQVQLRLIPVTGSYQAALVPIEQELGAEVQSDQQVAEARVKQAEADAQAAEKSAKSTSADAKGAAEAAKQAANDALGEARNAEAAAKDASEADAVTHIDLPGIHITADDSGGGRANVNVGSVHVNAGDQGAEIRVDKPVRLRGEALSPEKRGFRATYILAKDNLRDGWRAVGYEAAGPKVGPITVAVVKSRSGEHDHILNDVKRLVHRNGGV
jgi:hypothetical protein